MKLIAKEWISDDLPVGTPFEIPDHDAASGEALVEAGLAQKVVDAPEDQAAADQPPAAPESAPRRSYRRRDLTAEP
ncbi:MAG: hypothetical protein ABI665_26715 [Vicinamibacterales bacterium]